MTRADKFWISAAAGVMLLTILLSGYLNSPDNKTNIGSIQTISLRSGDYLKNEKGMDEFRNVCRYPIEFEVYGGLIAETDCLKRVN